MIEIPLTQGQLALIDDEDFELVNKYNWIAHWDRRTKSFYATTRIGKQEGCRKFLRMHRLIMNAKKGQQVDHIHHLTLDNRKSQLRLCSHGQNQHNRSIQLNNTSGFKGVSYDATKHKWRAFIGVNGKNRHLGYFIALEMAHTAYCRAALELYGEFACFG